MLHHNFYTLVPIHFYRCAGINLLPEEGPGWWPDVDLIEHYKLGDYQDSKLEQLILGKD